MTAESASTSTGKTLHVVATSHLDTQWRWTFQDTITRFIPRTLDENFALFEKYPNYVFSFEGAFRYMLAKEYFPDRYERLKKYIAEGRWALCGSVVDTGDVNTVSPESLIRQILYGNGFFRREFGKMSRDIFLPDCFGFGWALPSLAAHCGLKGFSTSKLEWGPSVPIPFDIGFWEGVDGRGLVACINPGQYSHPIKEPVHGDAGWLERIDKTGSECGRYVGFKYFGLGDTGGGPDHTSVRILEESIAAGGEYDVIGAAADALCQELTGEEIARLPRHASEFLLIEHGTGTYTANGAMKRWNRKNELLADAAERAAVIANWLGGAVYPREKLYQAWIRVLANQMHDILPGTCIPEAYEFSWNDEVISLNQFAEVLRDSVGALARTMDTDTAGVPVLVFNPLSIERHDIVEATVPGHPGPMKAVAPDGTVLPCQVLEDLEEGKVRVIFPAHLPSLGIAVYSLELGEAPPLEGAARATNDGLENGRYRVRLDTNGNIASIMDKESGGELLSAPIKLQLLGTAPKEWPAWTINHEAVSTAPYAQVEGSAEIAVAENGPVRATVEVRRTAHGSVYRQRVSLAGGPAGTRVEVDNEVVWETKGTVLKAAFPLSVANPEATYDLGLGTIRRGNNHERLHEVPAQQWVDLTDIDGSRGVTLFSDCKYGWDKPDDGTLRLTLLHTPEMTGFECHLGGAEFLDRFLEQEELDFGRHKFVYAVSGHTGDWRKGNAPWEAARLNQPLLGFLPRKHAGRLGRVYSFASVSSRGVVLKAFKQAEESDEVIVRLFEMTGKAQENVEVTIGNGITSARETDGMEDTIGPAKVRNGKLVLSLRPWEPRTFAVRLKAPSVRLRLPACTPVEIPFDLDAISEDANRSDGDIDGRGHSLPAELLGSEVVAEGIRFTIGSSAYREKNALVCRAQRIALPGHSGGWLYLLGCSVEGDVEAEVMVDGIPHRLLFQRYDGKVGSWDSRIVNGAYVDTVKEMIPGFVKRGRIAWVGTHRHQRASNADEVYTACYLYKMAVPISKGARELMMPDDTRLRVFAVTIAENSNEETVPAGLLYD